MAALSVSYQAREPKAQDVATRFLQSLCSLDADQVLSQLSEDAALWTGGIHAAGKRKIRKALLRAISSLNFLRCEPAVIWVKDGISVIEADVRCERADGAWTAFPLTVVLRSRGPLVSDIRLFTYEPSIVTNFLEPRRH